MATTLDILREEIARLEKVRPQSPSLKDLKAQLGAYTNGPLEIPEYQWHSGNQAVPGSATPPSAAEPAQPAIDEIEAAHPRKEP